MTKKVENVANVKNSSVRTNVKNVVTNNTATRVTVDSVELTAKDRHALAIGSALSNLSEYGVVEESATKEVSKYDEYKKTTYLDSLKSRWILPELTMAQKLVKAYKDGIDGIDYSPNNIGMTSDLAKALGPGRCLSLWYTALPQKRQSEIRKILNEAYPNSGYEFVPFDDFLKIVNEHYKDLLNLLGFSGGVARNDMSVNGEIVAWSVLNDDGKKNLHESGLYYRVVANDVGGWCAALSSLDTVTKYRMRVAMNKISANKYSHTNVVNYIILALESGVSVDDIKEWVNDAVTQYETKIAKEKLDAVAKIRKRIEYFNTQLEAAREKYLKLCEKESRFIKFASLLDSLRAAADDNNLPEIVRVSAHNRVLKIGPYYPTAYAAKLPGLVKSAKKRCDKLSKEIVALKEKLAN